MKDIENALAKKQQVQNSDILKKQILSMIEGKIDMNKIELIITN